MKFWSTFTKTWSDCMKFWNIFTKNWSDSANFETFLWKTEKRMWNFKGKVKTWEEHKALSNRKFKKNVLLALKIEISFTKLWRIPLKSKNKPKLQKFLKYSTCWKKILNSESLLRKTEKRPSNIPMTNWKAIANNTTYSWNFEKH